MWEMSICCVLFELVLSLTQVRSKGEVYQLVALTASAVFTRLPYLVMVPIRRLHLPMYITHFNRPPTPFQSIFQFLPSSSPLRDTGVVFMLILCSLSCVCYSKQSEQLLLLILFPKVARGETRPQNRPCGRRRQQWWPTAKWQLSPKDPPSAALKTQ